MGFLSVTLPSALPSETNTTYSGGLPETLDGTHRRTLRDINKAYRGLTHRHFGCVSVARRPLRAEELAELLASIPAIS